ncbi:MAG: T9SS type A sorting domain-containing protein [Bacteroidia bacterium]
MENLKHKTGGGVVRFFGLILNVQHRKTLGGMLLGLFSAIGANAQYVHPVTPDNYSGCDAPNVRNTGTSTFEHVQVIVHDGDNPSILFYDYATSPPAIQCLSLEADNRGARVVDPDVVWNYANGDYILVVYESDYMQSQGIWSEVWNWNGGSPVLESSYGTFAGMEPIQTGSGQSYPNVDADYRENAVIVWERGSAVQAVHFDFSSLTLSPNFYTVNSCALTGIPAWEPDVAVRDYNGQVFVSFTFVLDNGTNNDVYVHMEQLSVIVSGGIGANCDFYQCTPPIGYTSIHNPRIAMPDYATSGPSSPLLGYDANVVYALRDGGQSLIGNAHRRTLLPSCWGSFCPVQTYNDPVPGFVGVSSWVEEIIMDFANITHPAIPSFPQLIPPFHELSDDINELPVTTFAGDLIAHAVWEWTDLFTSPAPRIGLHELLTRRFSLTPDGNVITDPVPPYDYIMHIPAPGDHEYFIVGEGFTNTTNQGLVSTCGTEHFVYFAFYDYDVEQIVAKECPVTLTSPLRKAPEHFDIMENSLESFGKLKVYPNPVSEQLVVESDVLIVSLNIFDAYGRMVFNETTNSQIVQINIKALSLKPGVYNIQIHDLDGVINNNKILVK